MGCENCGCNGIGDDDDDDVLDDEADDAEDDEEVVEDEETEDEVQVDEKEDNFKDRELSTLELDVGRGIGRLCVDSLLKSRTNRIPAQLMLTQSKMTTRMAVWCSDELLVIMGALFRMASGSSRRKRSPTRAKSGVRP